MSLFFRDGLIWTAEGLRPAGVRVSGGRVVSILEPGLPPPPGALIVEAQGLWLLPGGVDAHVHGRDPGWPEKEDFDSLTSAAAAGGVTCVADMPNTRPATDDGEALIEKAQQIGARARIDFALWGGIRSSTDADRLESLAAAGAVGFKAYLGYAFNLKARNFVYSPEVPDPDFEEPAGYGTLAKLAGSLARIGRTVAVHAEDASVLRACRGDVYSYEDLLASRPAAAEAVAVAALGAISMTEGLAIHVPHLSSAAGLECARRGRAAGARLTLETCPQYLYLDSDDFVRAGSLMRMNPPVRRPADREALVEALRVGEIDLVATDHAPHTDLQKLTAGLGEAEPGNPGVQLLYLTALDLARRFGDPSRAPVWVSEAPARLLGIWPQKGSLEPGADADIVLVDPAGSSRVEPTGMFSRQRHSPLEGRSFGFSVEKVYSRGELVFDRGRLVGPTGRGRLVRPGAKDQPGGNPHLSAR